ncbi:MAG TPA: molybdopterin cofactor-binding domain-containing protein, partial [Gemmatimonadaceae bacterium]|nr:molybdopterin cofactor-binding domain-containing protein [Gemmatimonadaceae bacterium]
MSARDYLPWMSAAATDAPTPSDGDPATEAGRREAPIDADRRDLVKLLGMGGLLFAAGPFGIRRLEGAERLLAGTAAAEPWEAHAYIRLGEDGIVTLVCHRSEMGQGIRTTMPMILADEMEADWSKCRVEQAVGDEPKYGSQNTDGSTSIRDFLSKYREAGSTVRALLEDAAAKEWGVSASEVKAQNGQVVHTASGRTKAFGALVATARTLPMPAKERVRIKTKGERRWEGKGIRSIDLVPMTTGTATYAADVVLPGMKVAVIARPAVWGGKVVSVDDRAALEVPGVEKVLRLPEGPMPGAFFPLGGVAVVARNTWAAMKGRDALKVTWDDGANKAYDSVSYKAALMASVRQPGKAGRTNGDAAKALASASRKLTAEYYVPHLSHAQMEPVAAIAKVEGGKVEAWA